VEYGLIMTTSLVETLRVASRRLRSGEVRQNPSCCAARPANPTCIFVGLCTGCGDHHGHGSHVAGTAAGANVRTGNIRFFLLTCHDNIFQFGVAKGADIIAVKILDARGRGSYAGMIAGLDYVAGEKISNPEQPMVINLSVAGPKSRLANKVVDNAVELGHPSRRLARIKRCGHYTQTLELALTSLRKDM
jgi:hypothetical protein